MADQSTSEPNHAKQFGKTATLAIVAASGPGFIGTFVVAVQRYVEDGEEDDRRLMEEERRAAQEEAERPAIQGPVLMKKEKDDV